MHAGIIIILQIPQDNWDLHPMWRNWRKKARGRERGSGQILWHIGFAWLETGDIESVSPFLLPDGGSNITLRRGGR